MDPPSPMPWTLLEANDSSKVPLFYRFKFDTHGYSAQLTDFNHAWQENLTKADIVGKAKRANSSIDPSQDDSQLFVIYDKLKDAFAARASTSLIIDETSSEDSLSVHVKCVLPKPLRPFKWKLRFIECRSGFLRDAVLIPVARKCHQKDLQIDALVKLLAEKDDALAKVLDKADSAGLDLSTIFPSARSRSDEVLTRKLVVQRVKALRRFSPEHLTALPDADTSSLGLEQLFSNVLSSTAPSEMPEMSGNEVQNDDGRSPTTDGDSDGYQRQATPPPPRVVPLRARSTLRDHDQKMEDVGGDETTDDSDLDEAGPKYPPAGQPPPAERPLPAEQLPPSPQPKGRRRIGTIASRKAPESSSGPVPPASEEPEPPPAATKPQKSRIGSVGGKRAVRDKDYHAVDEDKPSETTATFRSKPAPDAPTEDEKMPSLDQSKTSSAPEESLMTEDERANEKRAQLKRELEAQSKVVTKKKRKF